MRELLGGTEERKQKKIELVTRPERQFPWSDYLSYDLVYYERWWNGEVACLYGLKNTPATREWLLTWAREDDQPYRHRLYLWTL